MAYTPVSELFIEVHLVSQLYGNQRHIVQLKEYCVPSTCVGMITLHRIVRGIIKCLLLEEILCKGFMQ